MSTTCESVTDVLNLAFTVYCHSKLIPERRALVVDDRAYTYGELAEQAARVAAWVKAQSNRSDRPPRVGILAARSFETYAGILGTAWTGATYIPLNPRQPADRLESILRRVKLDAIIVDEKGAPLLKDLAGVIPPSTLAGPSVTEGTAGDHATPWSALPEQPKNFPPPVSLAPDHPVYVIFTSGTTGIPKGVVAVAGGVAHYLAISKALYRMTPDDRVAQCSETTFDVSTYEMYTAWEAAAALHVVPEYELMMPGAFIRRHELTMWSCVPSVVLTMRRARQLEPGSYPTIRGTYFIGEPLALTTVAAWRAAAPNSFINNEYGPTETTVACTVHCIVGEPVETKGRGTVSIGNVYPGMRAAVRSADGKWLGPNEIGELALSGAQMSAGYLDDPEQTARRFPTLDHPEYGRAVWYLTGDFAYADEQGLLHCLGRMDNQVKILGHRVELEDVEANLRQVCGTDLVAAVAWPVVDGHATGLVGFVCGASLPPAAARDELRKRVPVYMVPRRLLALENMPLNANGKTDRKALKKMLEEGSL
ncbi:MAG: hypothetical protein QOE14_2606 [Humisphaera sp.]|nr:hypothetical protein [Humisphaera sp.]